MANNEAFTVTPISPAPVQTPMGPSQQPQLEQTPQPPPMFLSIPPGAIVIRHVNSNTGHKRKRGRPRIFRFKSTTASSGAMPQNISPTLQQMKYQTPISGVMGGTSESGTTASATVKKVRGRPPGSTNKKEHKEATANV